MGARDRMTPGLRRAGVTTPDRNTQVCCDHARHVMQSTISMPAQGINSNTRVEGRKAIGSAGMDGVVNGSSGWHCIQEVNIVWNGHLSQFYPATTQNVVTAK